MASEKKIDFLTTQGFSKDAINLFIEYGIDKNLLWFLGAHKKNIINSLNKEEIILVNKYIESFKDSVKHSYPNVLKLAMLHKQNQDRKNKNIIYVFDNGYYISILNKEDLKEEASIMSNCVFTHYYGRVEEGQVGILALKQSSGKTVAHIEIQKNGLIAQNYAKANKQMGKDEWTMIYEFFSKNSKGVDLSSLFGEAYVAESHGAYIDEVILSVPTSVNVNLHNGTKQTSEQDGFEVKRFSLLPKRSSSTFKIPNKSEIINWIENKKQEVNKFYDELISLVSLTSACNLYLSDEIKEKIFGSKKEAYLMKGNSYNLSEIDPRFGSKNMTEEGLGDAMAEPDGEMEIRNDIAIPEDRPLLARPRRRVGNINRALNEEPAPMQAVENLAVVEVAMNEEDMAVAVDEDGQEYEVNMNDMQEVDREEVNMERGDNEAMEELARQPTPFEEILNRAN